MNACRIALVLVTLLTFAPLAAAGEDAPAPDAVARWILEGDAAARERAVAALTDATPAYVAEVLQAIRTRAAPATPAEQTESDAVLIELALWSVPGGTTKEVLKYPAEGGVHFLDARSRERVHAALEATPDARLLRGPSLVVEDRQEASLAVTEKLIYVERYELVETRAVARKASLHEGVTLSATPVISADRRYVTVELELNHIAIERPIATKTIRLEGIAEPLEIQTPVVRETPARVTVTVPAIGKVALTGQPDARDPARELIVLLGASVLNTQEAPPELPSPTPAQDKGPLINVEVKVLEVVADVARRVLADRAPDADTPFRLLRAEDVLGLLGPKREGAPGVKILTAPRITTYDGQRANVSVLNQTSYVKDFEIRVFDGGGIADPIVDTIQDGLILELTPRISDDRTGIAVNAEATWADLKRPIAEFTTKVAGRDVTVQIPELTVSRANVSGKVAPGGYALIGGLGQAEDGLRYVLLHLSVIRLEDLPGAVRDEAVPVTPR